MAEKIIKKKEKGMNRHWKNFLDKEYLGSHNLERGEEMLLTIAKFEGEEMVLVQGGKKDEKQPKQVLYFKEEVPKMIINVTNGTTIASLYGPHPEDWIGKKIQVYATPVRAFGKTQDALRIRDFKPDHMVNDAGYISQLRACKTLEELASTFGSFPRSAKASPAVVAAKDELKAKFSA